LSKIEKVEITADNIFENLFSIVQFKEGIRDDSIMDSRGSRIGIMTNHSLYENSETKET
jgi:hypothetical protein